MGQIFGGTILPEGAHVWYVGQTGGPVRLADVQTCFNAATAAGLVSDVVVAELSKSLTASWVKITSVLNFSVTVEELRAHLEDYFSSCGDSWLWPAPTLTYDSIGVDWAPANAAGVKAGDKTAGGVGSGSGGGGLGINSIVDSIAASLNVAPSTALLVGAGGALLLLVLITRR